MGQTGELARSANLPDHPPRNDDGTYELGKTFVGNVSVEIVEKDEKQQDGTIVKKKERVEAYDYDFDLIQKNFLTPAPVIWKTPGKRQVLELACGQSHLLVAARSVSNGSIDVYSSGHNNYGQLGHGDLQQRHVLTPVRRLTLQVPCYCYQNAFFSRLPPFQIEGLAGKAIHQVACGAFHSLALNALGNAVFAWGRSDYGQLGLFDSIQKAGDSVKEPKQVEFPPDITSNRFVTILSGDSVSAAVTDDHQVYTWGYGDSNASGHKGDDDIVRPKRLNLMRKYNKESGPKTAHTYGGSGGGQHTLLLVKRYQ